MELNEVYLKVIETMVTLVVTVLVPYLAAQLAGWVKRKTDAHKTALAYNYAYMLVTAADQLLSSSAGQEKFDWVAGALSRKYPWLSEEQGQVIIESVVGAWKSSVRAMAKPEPEPEPVPGNVVTLRP